MTSLAGTSGFTGGSSLFFRVGVLGAYLRFDGRFGVEVDDEGGVDKP